MTKSKARDEALGDAFDLFEKIEKMEKENKELFNLKTPLPYSIGKKPEPKRWDKRGIQYKQL